MEGASVSDAEFNAIHQISQHPADNVVYFVNTYPRESVMKPWNNRGLVFILLLYSWEFSVGQETTPAVSLTTQATTDTSWMNYNLVED